MGIWTDFLGTTEAFFRLGLTGPRLKDSGGNLAVRNPGDTANAQITASKLNNTGTSLDIGTANILTLSQNGSQSGALTVILPAAKSTDGYSLAQKAGTGAGIIEFELVPTGSTSQCQTTDTTTLNFGSSATVAMFNLPAGGVISRIEVVIDTPFNTAASASVGITGTLAKYLPATRVDLTAPATTSFDFHPNLPAPVSQESLIITYSANSATVGSARFLVYFATPV
jgi:hypothetical protein